MFRNVIISNKKVSKFYMSEKFSIFYKITFVSLDSNERSLSII